MKQESEQNGAAGGAAGTPAQGTGTSAVAAKPIDEVVMAELTRAIGSIEFGSVLVKIHQGEVVGIETSTKVRLAQSKRTSADG
ncbi:MAG TPA: YezD family protein [Actinomycetota bacterium]|nr:YezD family protein [Actinomycetota bacterium]